MTHAAGFSLLSRSRRRTRRLRILSILVVLAFLDFGCSAQLKQFPDYPAPPAAQCPYADRVDSGLVVGMNPLSGKQDTMKYFGKDLGSRKVLAVAVSAENESTDASFLISPDRIILEGTESEEPDLERIASFSSAKTLHSVGLCTMILLPVGLIIASSGTSKAKGVSGVRENVLCKQLRTTTLSPGEKASGFVFFFLPEDAGIPDNLVVRLQALNLKTQQWQSVEFPISWRG